MKTSNRKRLYFTTVVLLCIIPTKILTRDVGQTITGRVFDSTTGESLSNVNVLIHNLHQINTTTDREGIFSFTNIKPGVYDLEVDCIGYADKIVEQITVDPENKLKLKIALEPVILQKHEIVVTATRSIYSLKDVPVETNLLSAREFKGLGLQTLTDVIRWVPGLNISGGAPNGAARRFTPLIHGLPAQYSMVLIDGHRAKSEHIHTGININLIPIGMIDRIEVVKGPASAMYGSEAFGGVVNIITKPVPTTSSYGTEASYGKYNTRNINLYHGSSISGFGYYINANYVHSDGVPDAQDLRFDFDQFNLMGKLAYSISKDNILKLDTRFYKNKYLRSTSVPKVNDYWTEMALSWQNKLSDHSSLHSGMQFSHFSGEYQNDDNRTVMGEMIYQGELSERHSVTSGVELRQEIFSRTATPEKETTISSAFVKDELKFKPPLTAILAFRADHHPNVATEISPKVGALYRLSAKTDIRASVGRGFRAPSLQDLNEEKFDHKTYYRDGNANLKPEYSINCNFGIEHLYNDHLGMRVSGFYNEFNNMIMSIDSGEMYNGKPVFRLVNIREALTHGLETEFRAIRGSSRLIIAYTYADTRDNFGAPLAYSPKHNATMRFYQYLSALSCGALMTIEYGGDRYFRTTSGVQGRLSDYTLVNLSLNKKLANEMSFYIRVENLANQKFEIYEDGKTLAGYGRTLLFGLKYDHQ